MGRMLRFMHSRHSSRRPGAVLLEVVVSLAILAAASIAMLTSILQARRTIQRVQQSDRDLIAAIRLLDAATLWNADELDRRLGQHPQGPWTLEIQREAPALYRLTLRNEPNGTAQLETYVARPLPGR
jgi:type II secretory pathway pseudopilin PulG